MAKEKTRTKPRKQWKFRGTPEEYAALLARRSASARAAIARMTPEAKAERYGRSAAACREAWAKKTPEELSAFKRHVRAGQAKMTREARAEMLRKQVATRAAKYAAMTPEEKAERIRKQWDPSQMTDADRAAYSETMRKRARLLWDNMTPAKKKRWAAKVKAGSDPKAKGAMLRAKFAAMTPEEREAWRKKHYTKERMEKTRVKRMETMRNWSPEKKHQLGMKIAASRKRSFAALTPDEQKAKTDQRYRTPERRARQSELTKAWWASLSADERQEMIDRVNTKAAHAKCGLTHRNNLLRMSLQERRRLTEHLHTPEVRAKSAQGVKAWFDALSVDEKIRVVAVIQAKERLRKKRVSRHL